MGDIVEQLTETVELEKIVRDVVEYIERKLAVGREIWISIHFYLHVKLIAKKRCIEQIYEEQRKLIFGDFWTQGYYNERRASRCIPNFLLQKCLVIFLCIFCPGTMTTHAESINSDLQRGLDRRLRHTHNIEHRTEPVSH